MNGKFARWGLSQLVVIVMLVIAGSAFAAGESLVHNSNNLGTKYGNWGVVGGKYGEFTCTTCHNKTTDNVKRVSGTITAPQGNWSSSKAATVSVVFNNMTAFGNDAGGHVTSTRVCQVCHSKTTVHKYNTTGQADLDHKGANQTDCTVCHSHADAFKGKGCTACHGSTAASSNPIITGKHTAHIANAVYGCADCHAKSVTGDDTIKSAPTAHQNSTYGDFSGARAGGSYAAGNCSNVYCHTDGKGGVPAVAVNWATGPALDCKGCHGAGGSFGEPAYVSGNSHAKHVSAAADCVNCHYATTANGTSIKAGTSHTNKSIEVDGSSSLGFASVAKTCSTASCHADPYSAGNATTPAWGTSADCSACHSAFPIGATGPATGSHTNTASHAVACITCHEAGTTVTSKPSSGHADGNIDTANVGYATLNKTKGTAGTTCSTASCHADPYSAGTVVTPAWGSTGNDCAACHTGTKVITATGPATGSHTTVASHAVACITCHAAGTTATAAPSTGHRDTNIDVANVGYATLDKTKGTAGTTCSTASCHANVYAAGTMTTPAWGSTGNGCSACHSVAIGATGPATGSHATVAGHAVACITCHEAGTTATTKPSTGHNDTNIDVANVGYATLNKTKGTAGTTCSTATCHADPYSAGYIASPAWGTTANGCSACHSGANVITANGPATGSHTTVAGHAVACITCHEAGTTATTAPTTGHADTNIDVANVGYATLNKTKGTVGTTCSAASCHANVYGAGSTTSPAWGSTGNGCSACHSIAIGVNGPLTGSHTAHAGRACTSCHAAGTTATSIPSTGHNNNNIDIANVNYQATVSKHASGLGYSSCSNIYCHSYGTTPSAPFTAKSAPVWGDTTVNCYSCHGSDSTTGLLNNMSTGRHKKHMVGQYSYGCAVCHAATVSNNTTVSDPTKHVNVQIDVAFSGTATNGGASASYATTGHAPGSAGTVDQSCSNVYCHSNAQTGGQVGTNYYFRNLTGAKRWGQTGSIGGCSGCHTTSTTITGKWTLSGAHLAHVSVSVNPQIGKAVGCSDCHANGGTNLNRANHVNGLINYSSALGGSIASGNLKLSTGRCNTVYCHSNGQGAFNNMSTNNWFSGVNLSCNGCHGDTTSLTSLSGKHDAHVNKVATGGNFGCATCHASTATNNTTLTATGKHVNAFKDFSGAKVTKTGFVPGNGTCTNSCHTDGRGGAPAVAVTWTGATIDCAGCHAMGTIATGGHQSHITHAGITCANCHNSTTNDSATITGATHIDGTVTLQQGGTFNSQAVTFTPAAGGCNNISCHGGASATDWNAQATCATCHPNLLSSGHHSVHMGALNLTDSAVLYNMTANRTPVQNDTVKTHGFGCANCHPLNIGNHINGSIDVDMSSKGVTGTSSIRFLNSTTVGKLPSYAGGTCANIYCHSNASRVTAELVYKATPAWVGGSFTGDRCAGCHDNQPATGAHGAHAVGNHSDNIYNGKNGKIAVSRRANTSHGNPNNSTTIGCYICHYATVTSSANDKNLKCVGCHNGSTADIKGDARIANLRPHVNGAREIEFKPIQVLSKAQIRPESFKFYSGIWMRSAGGYKTYSTLSYDIAKNPLNTATMWLPGAAMFSSCQNIACHNGKTVKWNLANWNDPNKCMDCHNQL